MWIIPDKLISHGPSPQNSTKAAYRNHFWHKDAKTYDCNSRPNAKQLRTLLENAQVTPVQQTNCHSPTRSLFEVLIGTAAWTERHGHNLTPLQRTFRAQRLVGCAELHNSDQTSALQSI